MQSRYSKINKLNEIAGKIVIREHKCVMYLSESIDINKHRHIKETGYTSPKGSKGKGREKETKKIINKE